LQKCTRNNTLGVFPSPRAYELWSGEFCCRRCRFGSYISSSSRLALAVVFIESRVTSKTWTDSFVNKHTRVLVNYFVKWEDDDLVPVCCCWEVFMGRTERAPSVHQNDGKRNEPSVATAPARDFVELRVNIRSTTIQKEPCRFWQPIDIGSIIFSSYSR
jgi:hypothetical protein